MSSASTPRFIPGGDQRAHVSMVEAAKEGERSAAIQRGLEAGNVFAAKGLGVSSAAVWGAHKLWPAFRRGLGPSGKVAIAIMPPMAMWFLRFEHTVNAQARAHGHMSVNAEPLEAPGATPLTAAGTAGAATKAEKGAQSRFRGIVQGLREKCMSDPKCES